MSVHATPVIAGPVTESFAEKRNDLHRRIMQAVLSATSLLDDIPNGAVLVLFPDDGDATFAAAEVESGLLHLRLGQEVSFRHVVLAELPEAPPLSNSPVPGQHRTFFNWDRSISSQEIVDEEGAWRVVDPPAPVDV